MKTKMIFGPIKKLMPSYPSGDPTGILSWGCEIAVGGETRILFVSKFARRSDFRGELRAVKRGYYGLRRSDTNPRSWCLVVDARDCKGEYFTNI